MFIQIGHTQQFWGHEKKCLEAAPLTTCFVSSSVDVEVSYVSYAPGRHPLYIEYHHIHSHDIIRYHTESFAMSIYRILLVPVRGSILILSISL